MVGTNAGAVYPSVGLSPAFPTPIRMEPMSAPKSRPLSPHLQIYRWPLNMALSILHRMSGVALAIGLVLVTWFCGALAAGPDAFATFTACATSWIGILMVLGWSGALCYHACTGIRHFLFDLGYLYDTQNSKRAGQIVLGGAIILTLLIWLCVFAGRVGP